MKWLLRAAVIPISIAVAAVVALPAHAAAPAYTALGDSYASGVGTRSYISDGTSCQRSNLAYPVLDAQRLGATLTFAACGGARIPDVLNTQLGSLTAATGLVSITVGGNDAGFSTVLTQCAKPWPYNCGTDITRANTYIQNTLPGALNTLYGKVRSLAPNARVVVVGYPRLFNGEECNILARISPDEQSRLNSTANLLNTTIAARASANGFAFVDPRTAFTGHAVCDDTEWINGLSNPVSESYHPNRTGQSGYANLVEPALRG